MQLMKKDSKKAGDHDIFLDFESAKPTEAELAVYTRVKLVLEKAPAIIAQLSGYTSAIEPIKAAYSNASNENLQLAAWAAVTPLAKLLKEFYEYSRDLEVILVLLLEQLCSDAPEVALESKQALAKQFAELVEFVLRFDALKCTFMIPNDLSFYRRTLSRMKMHDPDKETLVQVLSEEDANRMSLFYSSPTPMLKSISEGTKLFVKENKSTMDHENTSNCLGMLANLCRLMIETPHLNSRFTHAADTMTFCKRVMVGCIILYDHVHVLGAFSKKNPTIDIRASVKSLKMHDTDPAGTLTLLNALRFTSVHLNDEDTPKSIKALLAT